MTGPYTAKVFLNIDAHRVAQTATPDFTLTWEDDREVLEVGSSIAMRFYQRGGGATLQGTLQSAVFAVGAMLQPGERAYVRLTGREVARGMDDAFAGDATVRRDELSLISTLGSRWARERRFAV